MLTNDIIKKIPIFSKYSGHQISDFERIFKMPRKNLLWEVARLNEVLAEYEDSLVTIEEDRIHVPPIAVKDLFAKMAPQMKWYHFQDERLFMIIFYLFLEKEPVSNFHLQDLLKVSKNTVLSDLKELKQFLVNYEVQVAYSRSRGYHLVGLVRALHLLLEATINELLQFASGKWILRYIFYQCHCEFKLEEITQIFVKRTSQDNLHFVGERIEATSYLILALLNVQLPETMAYQSEEQVLIEQTRIMELVDHFVEIYPSLQIEKYFIASRLLGCVQGDYLVEADPDILAIMKQIIELVSAKTGINFNDQADFKRNLYSHLVPAYYRLVFEMKLTNPLKEQILAEYSSLFYLIKKSLSPLRQALGKEISDDEVAYFTMHFGGYVALHQPDQNQRQIVALSVCPNGVSSSVILSSELKALMPEIHFKELHQLDQLNHLDPQEYDLVFSTVFFETDKPLYVTQPFMNPVEKALLKEKVYGEFHLDAGQNSKVDDLMRIIDRYCCINDAGNLRDELTKCLLNSERGYINWEGINLNDLLKEDLIQQCEKVESWSEAIRLAAQPLLKKGYIEATYIEAMIDSVNRSGAYIVLAPHVAVPHAAPDKGVKRLGISLLQLKQAVDFNLDPEDYDEDRQVRLIFVLAAVDSSAHLKALQQLVMILDDESSLQALIEAPNCQAMYEIVCGAIQEEEEND
ncbi:BglG family transcription antiterminator [Vaginisenegalia massiliensis]|uniref:BglG family transcription antiterminator n=1 Tax=Vaginisenegalia massiliensis TaxID=2058294 RepID=UPI0013DDFA25|nr:BglG family transcription antiterminator [Vaginisenegalia massiliensis]